MSAVCQVTFLSTPCAELHGIELGQPGDLVCPPPQTRLGTASSRVPASPRTGSGQSFRRITEALQPRGLPRSYSIVFQRKNLLTSAWRHRHGGIKAPDLRTSLDQNLERTSSTGSTGGNHKVYTPLPTVLSKCRKLPASLLP